jgi:dihydroflavonol-4-reductase
VVFHLAAIISVTGDPLGRVAAVNVTGVENVAAAALACGVRRLVHCSSVHAFDLERAGRLLDETSPRAASPYLPAYDRSKFAGEQRLQAAIQQGLDAVIINPTGVIGPNDFAPSRMGRVLLALQQRRLPAVVGGGFDWVDVRDVCAALLAAETHGRRGENYLTPGHPASVRELATLAESVTGVPAPGWTTPLWLARLLAPVLTPLSRAWDNPLLYTSESLHALRFHPVVSGAKAEHELGHRPRPLADTIRDTYTWFEEHGQGRPRLPGNGR